MASDERSPEDLQAEIKALQEQIETLEGGVETSADMLKKRVRELTGINALMTILVEAQDITEMLFPVFHEFQQFSEAEYGLLHRFSSQTNMLVLEAYQGIGEELVRKVGSIEPDYGPIGKAFTTKEQVRIESVEAFAGRVRSFWEDESIKIGVSIPIIAQDEVLAIITLGSRDNTFFNSARMKVLHKVISRIEQGALKLLSGKEAGISTAGYRDGSNPVVKLINSLSDGVILADTSGMIVASNAALEQVSGYSHTDLVGQTLAGVLERWVAGEDLNSKRQLARHLNETHTPFNKPLILAGKDGVEYHAMLEGSFLNQPNAPFNAICVLRKTAKPLKSGQDIWRTPELAQALVELSPFGIIGTDLEGVITHVSPGALVMHGYGREDELIGTDLLELVAPEDSVSALNMIQNVRGRGALENVELVLLRRNGARFNGEASVGLINDPEGVPEGIMLIIANITARKRAENKAREDQSINLRDSLTGCYNRTAFYDELERLEKDLARSFPLTIITADVHGMDLVNDIFGKDSGDDVLIAAGELLAKPFRKIDRIARISGNRFVAILPNVSFALAMNKKHRIQQLIEKHNSEHGGVPLYLSIGASTTEDTNEGTIYDLYRRSEQDLEEVKFALPVSPDQQVLNNLMGHMEGRGFINNDSDSPLWDTMVKILRGVELSDAEVERLQLMVHAHNMGYILVAPEILEKPDALSPDEYDIVKNHSQVGCNIAIHSVEYAPIATHILHHHERWDGNGYPGGLKGKRIPKECRVFAIADAFAAMVSARPYREALGHEEAIDELMKGSGRQFDPNLLDEIVSVLE